MAIIDEIERSGRWLFRWRGHLPLLLAGLSVAAVYFDRSQTDDRIPVTVWEGICLATSGLGLVIRAVAIGHTPAGTSGRNAKRQVATELNTAGIYSVVRHPLYLGNFFLMLGVVLFAQSLWLAVFYALSFWLYYERIMAAEESFLRRSFGPTFEAWSISTPAFVPRLSQWTPSSLNFSFKNVIRREYNGFFAVFIAMFLLDVTRNFSQHGRMEADPRWTVMLGVSMTIWVLLRSLKRYTSLLRVDGR